MSTFYNLPGWAKVVLFTHQAIREDAHLLFGFGNAEERAVFRQLIKITGGARTALSILSGMSIADLAQAVTLQESGRLVKVPASARRRPNACCWNSKASWAPTSARAAPMPRRMRSRTYSTRCWRWATQTRKPCWH
jgi:Holliday junction resolvasome RuvABC DNA-binding subunit